MVDNTDNYFGAAPDHYSVKDEYPSIMGGDTHNSSDSGQLASRAATASGSSYWLANMAHGKVCNTNELLYPYIDEYFTPDVEVLESRTDYYLHRCHMHHRDTQFGEM